MLMANFDCKNKAKRRQKICVTKITNQHKNLKMQKIPLDIFVLNLIKISYVDNIVAHLFLKCNTFLVFIYARQILVVYRYANFTSNVLSIKKSQVITS